MKDDADKTKEELIREFEELRLMLSTLKISEFEMRKGIEELSIALQELSASEDILRKQNDALVDTQKEVIEDQKALECQRKRCLEVLKNNPVAYISTDTEGVILDANDSAIKLLGLADESFGREHLSSFVDEAHSEAFAPCLTRLMIQEYVVLELRLMSSTGTSFWAKIDAVALKHSDTDDVNFGWFISDISAKRKAEEQLREAYAELGKRVGELVDKEEDLKIKKQKIEETRTALKVLLEHREYEKKELEQNFISNLELFIRPHIEKLKRTQLNERQAAYVKLLESEFSRIVSPLLKKLSSKYMNLTPTEIQIAAFVRDGKSNKEISAIMGISAHTITFHRNNIRKKLGIANKKITMRYYLNKFDK